MSRPRELIIKIYQYKTSSNRQQDIKHSNGWIFTAFSLSNGGKGHPSIQTDWGMNIKSEGIYNH